MNKRLILLSLSLLVIFGFQNCAPAKFGLVDAQNNSLNTTPVDPGTPVVTKEKSFNSASKSKAIDMVWVIDNSASMTKNVQLVTKNFQSFVSTLQNQVDIHVALISRSTPFSYNTQISLPAALTASGVNVQINFLVHSYNPMLVAAASTCPALPTADDTFCSAVYANPHYKNAYGSLRSFFRQDSQKVFVIVSDDDSSDPGKSIVQFDDPSNPNSFLAISKSSLAENDDYIVPATFVNRMKSAFGASASYKTFGFISYDAKTSPCRAREGYAYQSLINLSGGQGYNICQTDWSSNFSSLTQSVIDYATTEYSLADSGVTNILDVTLNGTELVLGQDYTVNGDKIVLSSSLVSGIGNYDVDVKYETTTN
jgi:hypothetical protein